MNARNVSLGLNASLTPSSKTDNLNDVDRAVLEYGADMAMACCNMVSAGGDYEVQDADFYRGTTMMSAAALQARAGLDAAELVAAALDRNTAALARLGRLMRCQALRPSAVRATAATPENPSNVNAASGLD